MTDKPSGSWTLKMAPSDRRLNAGHDERVIQRWETKTMNGDDSEDTSNLEPYWYEEKEGVAFRPKKEI